VNPAASESNSQPLPSFQDGFQSFALSRFLRHRSFESLLVLKETRNALGQDSMLLRYFEMFDQHKLDWNEGNNLVVYHLKSLAEQHDNLLGHDRQPCGTVKDVVKDAIPAWNNYEKQKGWIVDGKNEDTFKSDISSQRKWAITRPLFKGAMGCCLWTLLAYWPSLKFTSIQQVHP